MREEAVRGVLVLFAAASSRPAAPAAAKTSGGSADAENGAMRVYVGTYTGGASRGIYLLELDRSSGRFVSGPVLAGETENPSFLALHPNGRFLYAVNELQTFEGKPTGTVSAFSVDPATGRLTFLNRQVSEGTDPCWVVVDAAGRNVLVANYTSGTVAVLPLSPDGRLQPASSVRHGSGSGPVRARQEGPHAHTVVLDAAVALRPLDRPGGGPRAGRPVRRRRRDARAERPGRPRPRAGLGTAPPRVAPLRARRLPPRRAERDRLDPRLRRRPRLARARSRRVSARADGASAENTAAEIAVSPDGRFLYTSNRGDDDLAVFAIDGASLRLAPAGRVPSGGRGPRSFALDPSGRWLVTANQGSGSLVVFRRDPATGLPAAVGAPVAVPEPVCVLFAPEVPAP